MSLPRYEPMTAVSWPSPFADDAWWFEPKLDGVRVLLHWDGAAVDLRTRRGRDASVTYPELAGFRHARPCVLDGEVVALDERGVPSFARLQQRMNVVDRARVAEQQLAVPISYVVFDCLHDGEPVVDAPLEERRARLAGIELPAPCAAVEAVAGDGVALWRFVVERDLEGMVAKRGGSPYRPGVRSADWRKVANRHVLRVVVGGYLPGDGGRAATFGSLLIGLYDGDRLRWVGAVGSGFDDATLVAVKAALDQMGRADSPFHPDRAMWRQARWVEPALVAVVEFKEWTSVGRLRAPVFKGFTHDPVDEVTWEAEGPGRSPG